MEVKRFVVILVIISITSFSVFSDIYNDFIIPIDPTSKEGTPLFISGELRLTVIPVYFPDLLPTLPRENITSLVFENISDYFFHESYGAVWFTGSILDWTCLDHNYSYYDRGSLNDPDPEIQRNASLGCQFFRNEVANKFTMTKSNYTEHILMLYAGGSTIHPHHEHLTISVDSILKSCEVAVAPELYSLATIAHEIAHGLGLHDLYNKDKQNCWGDFVGAFDLMDNSGYSRINGMCAYSKISLGWIKPDDIIDVQANATVRLLRIEEWGNGQRVVRIPIDRWRYYLIEARYQWPMSGILVSRVDTSRVTGGFGRVEVVRTARGVKNSRLSLFTEHQRFIDSKLGLVVEVLDDADPWHEINITFTSIETPQAISIPREIGEVQNMTSVVDLSGTSYFAVCATNSTTNLRIIHLYKLTNTLEYVLHSPFVNDSVNPVLVSGYDGTLLVFEVIDSNKHSVVAQFGENISVISEGDDARHPTAAFSANGLYIAYENHTGNQPSIIVRTASSYGWTYGISFQLESTCSVLPSAGGVPHSPQLIPANNYAALSYLWANDYDNELRLKWDIGSPNIALSFEDVESFTITPLSEYRIFLSLSHYSEVTTVYFWKSLENQLELISNHDGIGRTLVPILGVWEGYQSDERFVFNRIWDRWYRPGASLNLHLGTSRPLSAGLCSLYGSAALYTVSVEEGSVAIIIWPILSLSDGAERPIGEFVVAIGVKCLAASILSLVVYHSGDKQLFQRVRNFKSRYSEDKNSKQSKKTRESHMKSNPHQGRINEKIVTKGISERGFVLLGLHRRKNTNGSSRWGGWPDRIAIDPSDNSIHFFEVKTGGHKLDQHQRLVLGALAHIGTVHLLHFDKNSDTPSEKILKEIPFEELISVARENRSNSS